ncbi:hypothetical protein ACLMJK_000670 [Lecanora helva]
MMVPRAYLYSSPASTEIDSSQEKNRKDTLVEQPNKPTQMGKKNKATPSNTPPRMFSPQPPTPSKPVVIPTRSRTGGQRKTRESVSQNERRELKKSHDATCTPPSMAALLAMTNQSELDHQQESKLRRESSSFASRKVQNDRLRDVPTRTLSSSNPKSWDLLLSPPDRFDFEPGSFESDTTLGPISSLRSLSTESMPSLETDTESLGSASNPATPALLPGNRLGHDRRQKSLSTSVGENCALDHPLLPPTPPVVLENEPPKEANDFPQRTPSPSPRSRYYLKSNLTASFRKIRSAAQSFSAFTPPLPQREDYLVRSFLSMDTQYIDEKRPKPSADPPDPALRRYLNPITFSPAELHFHSKKSSQATRRNCTASIQLQTYQRPHRPSDKASSPPIFTSAQQQALDAVDGLPDTSSSRQREPRENSDFLRIIVLEMNMRKKGKLSDTSPGRAKLWLPARQSAKMITEKSFQNEAEAVRVPARWVGVQAL